MSCCVTNSFLSAEQMKLLAQNHKAVFEEICMIQQALLSHVNNPTNNSALYVSGTTPMTFFPTITGLNLISGGSGYTTFAPAITVNHTTGTGALLDLVIEDGIIDSVNVLASGTGYTVDPVTFTINHPTGAGAVLTFDIVAGEIISVAVVNGGTGYFDINPSIAIAGAPGTGANATFTVNPTTHAIENVVLLSGGVGYPTNTLATIIPAVPGMGTGANIAVQTRQNTFGTNPLEYYQQLTQVIDNVMVQSQLDQVKSHFINLGYAIDILVNPVTTNTIMWKISF